MPVRESWPELKYPTYYKSKPKTIYSWLEGRRDDDGAENLWRVHDGLYNLTSFVNEHPGGAMWLQLTKGTDITEAFESHHISKAAEKKLSNFFVKKARSNRNSPYTFNPDGFYRTLKQKIQKYFNYKTPAVSWVSTTYLDFYFHLALMLCVLAARAQSYALAVLGGIFFGFVINCGHNFLHMKDTWRIYYYSCAGFSVREWRISHCLSHHLYPNTLDDLEITLFEPFLQFYPSKDKSLFIRFGSWLIFPVVCAMTNVHQIVIRIIMKKFEKDDCLIFLPLSLMLVFGNVSFLTVLLWINVLLLTGFTFSVIGLTAAHHNVDNFHEGDKPRKDRDWGLQQFDAVVDRMEIMGNKFFGLILYGEHTLHHLFPTIDYCHLHDLTPILHETLKEFGIEIKQKPILNVIFGTFLQLARNEPRKIKHSSKKI